MDTIELWEQEIAQKEADEKALNEARIYNFYGEVEPVQESVLAFALAAAITATPIAVAGIIARVKHASYLKALKNFEKEHENDSEFIKISDFEVAKYDVRPFSDQLGKESKKNPFEKLIDKIPSQSVKDELFSPPSTSYMGKAMVFKKDNTVYFYMPYSVSVEAHSSRHIRQVKFVITSDIAKKYKDYYMTAACTKLYIETKETKKFLNDYKEK